MEGVERWGEEGMYGLKLRLKFAYTVSEIHGSVCGGQGEVRARISRSHLETVDAHASAPDLTCYGRSQELGWNLSYGDRFLVKGHAFPCFV